MDIHPAAFFKAPTVADLAQHVVPAGAEDQHAGHHPPRRLELGDHSVHQEQRERIGSDPDRGGCPVGDLAVHEADQGAEHRHLPHLVLEQAQGAGRFGVEHQRDGQHHHQHE
ncbi:hypothetical protein, partial [Bacillus subtilis]|uniref:hypothetical protein n=1 Tax=Bacillus subtilis TaxID=1423 RepID=UPI00339DA06F